AEIAPNAPPSPPETLATVSSLALELPVSQGRVTAIVYHSTGVPDAIPLTPAGTQRNAGFLAQRGDRRFRSSSRPGPRYSTARGSSTDASGIGRAVDAGRNDCSPVNGVVVSVQPYVRNARVRGSTVKIRRSALAAVIVTVGNLDKRFGVDVGTPVQASVTRLG